MKISQIIDKIDDRQLHVPAFQREYVWKRKNAKELIYSLIHEYPTGTMLTWETSNPPELKGSSAYSEHQGSVKLILDGQQRITTLYMIITGEIPHYYSKHEITQDTRNLYIHLETGDLSYFIKSKMSKNPLWVNLTDIFKGEVKSREIVKDIQKLEGSTISDERYDVIEGNIDAVKSIKEREFLEQVIPVKASIKEAIDIFYIVNSSGINLTDAELALAQISGYWPQAREEIKKKQIELEHEGYVFKLDFFMYVLLGVLYGLGSDMGKLHDSSNKESLQIARKILSESTLDYVFNIFKSQAYIDHTREINSVYALIAPIVFVYKKGNDKLSQIEISKMITWFYYSQIRTRYVSQLQQKLDKDLGIINSSSSPFDELLNLISSEKKLEIDPNEFIGVGVSHPLRGLMNRYFKSRGAICLTTGVSIRQNMGKKYVLERDHIFPYSVLKENGYGISNRHKYKLANEITNRAIVTQIANRKKGAKLPSEYLHQVKELFPNSLSLQLIPEDEKLWKIESFEHFLQKRREILAESLNIYLLTLSNFSGNASYTVGIDEIITDGENNEVEFKSSLRWDIKESRINKGLEQVAMKIIASFNNSNGGTLFIGVDDSGSILGLDNDYNTLSGEADEFELHLRNLIENNFGLHFSTSQIKISFPEIDGIEICAVEVVSGIKELYMNYIDKKGQKFNKFFVRSGNKSIAIEDPEKIVSYVSQRF